jgi:hypothetical protein
MHLQALKLLMQRPFHLTGFSTAFVPYLNQQLESVGRTYLMLPQSLFCVIGNAYLYPASDFCLDEVQ